MPASCSSLGKSCSSIPLCLCTGSSSFRFLENLCSLSLSAQLQQILLKGEHSHQYRREIIPKHPDHIRDPFPQCQKMSDPYHHLLFTPLFFFCNSFFAYLSLNNELFGNRGQALFLSVSFKKFHNACGMGGQKHGYFHEQFPEQ